MSFYSPVAGSITPNIGGSITAVSDNRPRGIRAVADAKAYELRTIARAEAQSEVESHRIRSEAIEERITNIARENPKLAERARQRLLVREIEGQLNVEQIADQAAAALPLAVSEEPIGNDWRRKFFQEAENVCDVDMQMLWGKVLAGEIARPGSFGLRTLETLKQLSRYEAELFRKICGLAMDDGWVALPGFDVNTDLKPFGFGFDQILELRDAGLILHGDGIHKSFADSTRSEEADKQSVKLTNNGIQICLSGTALQHTHLPALIFTQAGRELQRLVVPAPNAGYLASLGRAIRSRGLSAKRASNLPQSEQVSLVVYDEDL